MRFTSLHMTDFRATRELEIGFEPDVTVIVGRNGAGKTSILDALATTVRLAHARSKEPAHPGFGFRSYARDVREGAAASALALEYEAGHPESGARIPDTLQVRIRGDDGASDIVSLQDADTLSNRLFRQTGFVYYRQERGFGSGGAGRHGGALADSLDPEAAQDRSLPKDTGTIRDLSAWWDRRDAQEARRVRDGERGYRDPQLEAVRSPIARIDTFSGVAFDSTASPPGLHLP